MGHGPLRSHPTPTARTRTHAALKPHPSKDQPLPSPGGTDRCQRRAPQHKHEPAPHHAAVMCCPLWRRRWSGNSGGRDVGTPHRTAPHRRTAGSSVWERGRVRERTFSTPLKTITSPLYFAHSSSRCEATRLAAKILRQGRPWIRIPANTYHSHRACAPMRGAGANHSKKKTPLSHQRCPSAQ